MNESERQYHDASNICPMMSDKAFDALKEDIKANGLLEPIWIHADGSIIDGRNRHRACLELGVTPRFETYEGENPVAFSISKNIHRRDLTDSQRAMIAVQALPMLQAEAKAKMIASGAKGGDGRGNKKNPVAPVPQGFSSEKSSPAPKSRDIAAAAAGVSPRLVQNAKAVAEKSPELAEKVKTGELLIGVALREVKKINQQGKHDQPDGSAESSQTVNTISVQEWEGADAAQRSSWLALRSSNKFNETNDNIEWASWSWNPVTGCLHDCPYCYARDIATRFYPQKFTPSFLPDRLSAPANTKVPNLSGIDDPELRMAKRNVFVCSMADLFGKWVPTAWIDAVLQQAWDNPQWTFLFLTKFPVRMAEFEFPKNSWIGTTVDKQYAVSRAEKAFTKIRMGGYEGIAWLSCEPMMEKLTFSSLDMFDWVVMGGSSKSTQTPEHKPEFSWTNHLYNQAKALDLPVYMKTNLGIEQSVRVREYPTKA